MKFVKFNINFPTAVRNKWLNNSTEINLSKSRPYMVYGFAEVPKNLAINVDLKIILLSYQNNYIRRATAEY